MLSTLVDAWCDKIATVVDQQFITLSVHLCLQHYGRNVARVCVRPVNIYRPTDGVAWSVCLSVGLSVCRSCSKALQKRLCSVGAKSCGPKEPCVRWGADLSRVKGNFWGLYAPLKSIKVRCLSRLAHIRRRILTIHASFYIFPRKEVSFLARIDNTPHIGVEIIPKSPNWGTWIGIFKPNAHSIKTWILWKLLNGMQSNFAPWQRPQSTPPNTFRGGLNTRITNTRWLVAAI